MAYELAIGPIPSGMCVLHRCDVRSCINPAHLFLGTQDDNIEDRDRKERQARYERQWQAKLTQDAVREIRALRSAGASQRTLAKRYGVHRGTISYVVRNLTWKEI